MAFDYYEAASLAFGGTPFSTRDFATRTGSLRSAKTLSELKMRGLAERVSRGKYRLLGPSERPDLRSAERARVRRLLLASGLPMAWTGPTGVALWTGGRYHVSPSVYLTEFHISIPGASESAWRSYLHKHRISFQPSRRIGSNVVIHSTPRFKREFHSGEPVVPRADTLAMIRAHRGIYAEADKLVERGSRRS